MNLTLSDIRACLDLNNNPNLRVLHLHPLDHPSIPFISLQVANRIQKFIFTDAEYVIEAWDDMNNSKLDTLLASDTFKVLERVYLIRRGRASKVLTHTVSRVFPTLSTRGLLDLVESKGNLVSLYNCKLYMFSPFDS